MAKVKTKISPKKEEGEFAFTSESLAQFVDFRSRKLAVYLANAPLPLDVKYAWLDLLGDMTLSQIDELTEILEEEYLREATAIIDDYYKQRWERDALAFEEELDKNILALQKQVETIQQTSKELS